MVTFELSLTTFPSGPITIRPVTSLVAPIASFGRSNPAQLFADPVSGFVAGRARRCTSGRRLSVFEGDFAWAEGCQWRRRTRAEQ